MNNFIESYAPVDINKHKTTYANLTGLYMDLLLNKCRHIVLKKMNIDAQAHDTTAF